MSQRRAALCELIALMHALLVNEDASLLAVKRVNATLPSALVPDNPAHNGQFK